MDIFVCLLEILPDRDPTRRLMAALILVCRRLASALKHPASPNPVHDERGVRTYEVLAAAAPLVTVVELRVGKKGSRTSPKISRGAGRAPISKNSS
jgi:hypothetical protein